MFIKIYIGDERKSISFAYGIYEVIEINNNPKSILPENVQTDNTVKYIKMKSSMTMDTNENE